MQGLKELLARNGVVPELSHADAAYRSGLDNYFEGNYTDAIANFDNALALSPQYPGAFEMRTDAVRLRAELGDADKIARRIKEYQDRFANPFAAAERGYIDEVILPRSTRRRICRALNMLRNKTVENPWKKHDNIPL